MIDNGSNPLDNADVKQLLNGADNINSKHDFGNWQKSFLDAFTKFLDSEGSDKAKEAYTKFSTFSSGLFKVVKSLTDHIEQGTLSKERTSVKARRAVTELGTVLGKLVEALELILPTTSVQIKKFGFTKYHMGAVLVEDGFREYAVMQYCKKLLRHLRVEALDQLASKQVLDGIDYFGKKFDVFCGVMESLNLMNVCRIAEKFLHTELIEETQKVLGEAAPEPEPEPSPAKASADPPPIEKREFTVDVTYPDTPLSPNKTETSTELYTPEKTKQGENKDDASVSSYEEVDEIVTVSSYETVEVSDDSSYETIEVVESSEYTTEEEEVIVSDYVTDSSASGAKQKTKKKKKPKKKDGNDPSKKKKKKGNKDHPPRPQKKSAPPALNAQGTDTAQPKKTTTQSPASQEQREGLPPPEPTGGENQDPGEKNSDEEEDPDSNNSSDSEKKHSDKRQTELGSGSESSENGNIKPRASKAPDSRPASPTSNEKPVERIQFTSKDFYHGHSSNDCFNAWKLFKKTDSDSDSDSGYEERKKKRIERRQIVATRRKIKEREVKTIRQKKDKPPKTVRVRHTKNIVQKKLVKKEKLVE